MPTPEPPDAADGPGNVEDDDAWPQLSQLDLDVCLSARLPSDRKAPGPARSSPPPRDQA